MTSVVLRNRWLVGAVVAVTAVVGVVVLLGFTRGADGPGRVAVPAGEQVAGLVAYQDPQGRFTVSYPRGWSLLPSTDPQVALLASVAPKSGDSMLVRVVSLPTLVDPAHLDEVKAITDRLLQGSNVHVVVQRPASLGGLVGYYYLYTLGQPGSADFAVHAHYFLFSGSTMHVLVLQALPDTDFTQLAPTFDRIAHSYRVPAPPIPPTGAESTAGAPPPGG